MRYSVFVVRVCVVFYIADYRSNVFDRPPKITNEQITNNNKQTFTYLNKCTIKKDIVNNLLFTSLHNHFMPNEFIYFDPSRMPYTEI
jgi:hypothetical protein